MSRLGLSGARIHRAVVKTGPGCADQSILMGVLGDQVCPRVLGPIHDPVLGSGYAMEECDPVRPGEAQGLILIHMRDLLRERVWGRRARNEESAAWREELGEWLFAQGQSDLYHTLCRLDFSDARWSLIHGDPTIANAMRTAGGELRIADPLWPGGKIPSLRCVDLGKLLQSAVGWEQQLDPAYPKPAVRSALYLLDPYGQAEQHRAWFWAAVHCLRLAPYAERAGHAHLAAWGRQTAAGVADALRRRLDRRDETIVGARSS